MWPSADRHFKRDCCVERGDTGGTPKAAGVCVAPGGTPMFTALAPMYALRRRARMNPEKLPWGPLRKRVDPCCERVDDSVWVERKPWQKKPAAKHACNAIGVRRDRSTFRSLDRCGALATRRACACGDIDVDNCQCRCRQCEKECREKECLKKAASFVAQCVPLHDECGECDCYACQSIDKACAAADDVAFCGCGDDGGERRRVLVQREQRRAFKPNTSLLSNPSGRVEPVGETMRHRERFPPSQVQVKARRARDAQRFAPHKSGFRGNDCEFCRSLTCRYAGSSTGEPVEKRAAVCQLPTLLPPDLAKRFV